MSHWKFDGVRRLVLGAATTGLLLPSMPVFGQVKSLFPNPKTTTRKTTPVQPTEPPKLLAVPDAPAPSSQIVPTAGERSEVQKQIDALYEKDGREPPAIPMQPLQPLQTNAQSSSQQQNSAAPPVAGLPANSRPGQAAAPARPGQGHTRYQPVTQATPYSLQTTNPSAQVQRTAGTTNAQSQSPAQPQYLPQNQPRRNPVASFFKRIGGGSSNKQMTSQPPIPPDANNAVPGIPPASLSATTPPAQLEMAPALSAAPAPMQAPRSGSLPMLSSTPSSPVVNSSTNVQIIGGANGAPAELPQPFGLPALSGDPLPVKTVPAGSLPPLMTEPQANAVASKTASPVESTNPRSEANPRPGIAADFPDPFTEMNESEADKKGPAPTTANTVALDAPGPNVEKNAAPTEDDGDSEKIALPDEDPFSVGEKNFSDPVIDETVKPMIDPSMTTSPGSALPPVSALTPDVGPAHPLEEPSFSEEKPVKRPAPPVESPTMDKAPMPADTAPDPQVEKMKKIRERFGMKGLKGFCPVTLHDERELVDARPEFHFTHRSQKFHFATAEARDKFEVEPNKYAPAAYGADVVALGRDKDVVEGSLDYAAWFKGRLYLFGTQANYDTFIATPAKYATLIMNE